MNESLQRSVRKYQRIAIGCGVAGAAGCLIGAFVNRHQFFISYLWGYLFWLGVALGCMCLTMIHSLTGGRWGNVTRRFQEAAFMTLPVMAILFVPLFFGLRDLYPWARPQDVAADLVLQKRQPYMTTGFWVVRVLIIFAIWSGMAWFLRKRSVAQDHSKEATNTVRMRFLAGPGLVIYPLTVTVAYMDWIMSLETHWYSTMFPIIICIGQILCGLCFSIILLACFRHASPIAEALTTDHLHQLGNLLLAFVLFWTYVSFGQLLIIYSGNLPKEIVWYLHRIAGNWTLVVGAIALLHFFLPFYLLLFRPIKRSFTTLVPLAVTVFVMHMVDVFWYVTPTFFPNGITIHWLDLATPLGVGGIWVAIFLAGLMGPALMPQNDPRIQLEAPAHAR